jgi:ABC-type Fe3+/spermidine/putrescine transport system ATPase subunit
VRHPAVDGNTHIFTDQEIDLVFELAHNRYKKMKMHERNMFTVEEKVAQFNTWNKVSLTPRQHFIAHFLLWKSYGNSQSYAFWAMCNGQKNKHQSSRYYKINSRIYENVKKDALKVHINRKGKCTYIDFQGNKTYCSTNDVRVLSGELTPLSLGRKYKWNHSSEYKHKYNHDVRKRMWKDKIVNLYFLETKIQIKVTFGMPEIIPYLDQGWSLRRTREHHSYTASQSNKNRNRK